MRITVLYFAVFRERLGRTDELLELPAGATVDSALARLGELHAPVAALAGRYRVAVNQVMTDGAHVLGDGDELALIPPVAGGSGSPGTAGGIGSDITGGGERHVVLSGEPLSLDRCIAAVSGPGFGGVVTFTGMVRDHSHGQPIVRLEYEAYTPMAIRVMTELCDEIEAELPGVRLAVEHRVGTLAIGELAVAIAAAAPHRAEAFAACRALIDRLKDRVPIWKKEIGSSGEAWVGLGP